MNIRRLTFQISVMIVSAIVFTAGSATHPVLMTPDRLGSLSAGGSEWNSIKQYCDANLNKVISPDYAGWGWRTAVENYSAAYRVTLPKDAALADKYGKKTLAMMKVLARHHNYGGPDCAQLIGLGDGSTKTFALPMTPLTGTTISVFTAPVSDTTFIYNGPTVQVSHFDPIAKISNTAGGPANYVPADYKLLYRDGLNIFVLRWLGANHPTTGATYHVFMTSGTGTAVAAGQFTASNTVLTFTTAPAANHAVFVRYIADNYDQTGNLLGGYSSVTPDGPGYQMRTFCPGLAYGFDLMFDFSDFTSALKAEFDTVLNQEIDWYKAYGYEHDGDLGNYFIRGLLTGVMFTAYGTDGANGRAAEFKLFSDTCISRTFDKLDKKLPGGYGPQGQYTNGVANDVLQIFTIYQGLTGTDLLSKLEWTSNIIPATIHGTKPDRKTFYDGGDWSDLPATPLTGLVNAFLTYLPNHAMAPYARQLNKDIGSPDSFPGTLKDYKTDFPPAYMAKVSGPMYARSDWGASAVWVSLSAGEIVMDHQHYDQGHVTIQRGADYLLVDGGGYGEYLTDKHNTLMFDDRGAGNISTYPPGQGSWGFNSVSIKRFEAASGFVYGLADFTRSYAQAHDGINNSVKAAVRSVLFVRPGVYIVHDRAQTANTAVKKIFNCNFGNTITQANGIWTTTLGTSTLFMKSLMPGSPTATVTAITGQPLAKSNYQEMLTGQANNNFFHIFEACASTQTVMAPSAYIDAGICEGVEVKLADSVWVGLFAKTDSVVSTQISYSYHFSGPQRHVVSDLTPYAGFNVKVSSKGLTVLSDSSHIASVNGIATFAFSAADSGIVTLVPGKVPVMWNYNGSISEKDQATVRIAGKNVCFAINLSKDSDVNIALFNCAGRRVMGLLNTHLAAGSHSIIRNCLQAVPAGSYMVVVKAGTVKKAFRIIAGM
jgi:hypothetical protein